MAWLLPLRSISLEYLRRLLAFKDLNLCLLNALRILEELRVLACFEDGFEGFLLQLDFLRWPWWWLGSPSFHSSWGDFLRRLLFFRFRRHQLSLLILNLLYLWCWFVLVVSRVGDLLVGSEALADAFDFPGVILIVANHTASQGIAHGRFGTALPRASTACTVTSVSDDFRLKLPPSTL